MWNCRGKMHNNILLFPGLKLTFIHDYYKYDDRYFILKLCLTDMLH
jgi:hypothetical protein